MIRDIRTITQQLFRQENPSDVPDEELNAFVVKYPFCTSARYLVAQKAFNTQPDQAQGSLATASLYLHNPLRLDWLLEASASSPNPEEPEAAEQEPAPTPDQPPAGELTFQSYHTIDYFASQGIRLQTSELGKDKLGQQLKSFTDWLKSMKKLPSSGAGTPAHDPGQQIVLHNAEHSLDEKEVVTEAMAEVWLKQGHSLKAREIYTKLSLQNPAKSAYFAAKIEQLK